MAFKRREFSLGALKGKKIVDGVINRAGISRIDAEGEIPNSLLQAGFCRVQLGDTAD
jgi:hypothetical protein